MTDPAQNVKPDEHTAERTRQRVRRVHTSSIIRAGKGPRTLLGKRRSSQNSLKHGIFSKAVVLKNESQAEFDSVVNGLREHYHPVGTLEVILVEKLAATSWRQRRLLLAEAAEIQIDIESIESNEEVATLERRIELLRELKACIKVNGLNQEADKQLLSLIYRDLPSQSRNYGLVGLYSSVPATATECDRKEWQLSVLCMIDNEIDTFEKCRSEALHRVKLRSQRAGVPEDPRLGQFLRYGASLDREFDRTLSQLEREQRMRLGQPVAPRIDVNVSPS
jgi:hypothetical protein